VTQEDVEDIASASLTMLLFQAHKIDFSQPHAMSFVYCRTIIANAARDALAETLENQEVPHLRGFQQATFPWNPGLFAGAQLVLPIQGRVRR
jgi:hypothetical protein